MKVKDIPILKKKVLDILPITQAEVWKKLGIDSSEGSELIRTMLAENLIKRTKEGGTYLIESPNGDRTKDVKNIPIYTEAEDVPITDKKDIPKKAKARDISILRSRVLEMLPVMQSDIWKKLGIDRRTCSKIISLMIKDNLIKRTKCDHTFMIESANEIIQKKDYSSLLSDSGKFSPCCGCMAECEPSKCVLLVEWLL